MNKFDKSLNILVIEDNLGDYVLIEEYLLDEFKNPQIDHAIRSSDAERLLENGPATYNVILLDLSLPDKSGENLVDDFLKLAGEIPVIILTGYTDIDFSMLSISKGVSDYLLKEELSPALLKKSILYAIERNANASKVMQSEKNYRALFELSPEPMMLFDLENYRFLDVNEAAVSKYGYSKEEFLGMTLMDIKPTEEIAESKDVIEKTRGLTNIKLENDFRHITRSGEILLVEIHASTVEYNEKKVRMALAHDVTTKRIEDVRLRMLESVITNANEYVIIFEAVPSDLDYRKILYVNEAFTKITGYKASEVVGKTVHFLNGEDTSQTELERLYSTMRKWEMCEAEFINYKKDGSTFWARISLIPVPDSKGGFSHWIAIGRDISEQKKYETQLTESLKEKDILLSEIHHRVKNNLAVVSGMMQLQAFEEQNELVQLKLNDSILRIHTMATIHEILYQSGSFSKLRFSDVAEQLVNKISSVMGDDRRVNVTINKTPIQLNISQAIPSSLILNEVLTNAYKHAFGDRCEGNIHFQISEENNVIYFKVEDDGVGIASKEENTKSLGLHIVEILTHQLNGEQKMYDTGNGTAFELTFTKT
ncbi:MAG: PAS domain S-box protein [Balneolales bacterium]|nr:PAS domain S-box protein [Balneolales bacterium]